jgi:hypothetical protein
MSAASAAFRAQDLDRKGILSMAMETEIIKLLMRQFLTNKSVFEQRLYDRMKDESIAAVGGATSWREVGAAF